MTRDLLLLLETRFHDPALGEDFYCRDCITIEGLLAAYPRLADSLEIRRIAWPRPRTEVVDLIGEANQNLPVLILADDAPDGIADGEHEGRRFVSGFKALLHALHVRHGIPRAHP